MRSVFFTEDHITFRTAVRQFIEKEAVPHAEEWEAAGQIPRSIWHLMGNTDLLGINYPEEFGGMNADFFFSVVFLEELARSTMGGFAAAVGVHEYMALAYIHKFASHQLKEEYLRPGIRGEKIGALAITEPNTGSDVAALRTRAVREDDHYIINGSKTFITNGVYGDFIVLAVKTDPQAGQAGISLFVVDTNLPGVNARKLKKIGWNSSDTAELSFDDVKVPATHRIGEENMGFYYIMDCFQLERLVAAITAVAGTEYCLNITLQYLHEREAFKRPLAKFQVIRHTLSDLATELEAARQLTYNACWMYNEGIPAVQQCSMAKLYTTELAKKMADACLQYFGGYGYMDDYLISRIYRDARAGTIVGGTSEIMREIIAKLLIDNVEYHPVDDVPRKKAAGPSTSKKTPVEKTAATKTDTSSGSPALPEETKAPPEPGSETDEIETETETFEIQDEIEKPEGTLREDKTDNMDPHFKDEKETPVKMDNALQENYETEVERPQKMIDRIIFGLPERFRREKAAGYATTVHFKISGADGGEYTVAVSGGECSVSNGLAGQAKCLVETSAKTYIDMETGKTNPQIAFMMGKVKISNIPEMMQFIDMFRKLPDT